LSHASTRGRPLATASRLVSLMTPACSATGLGARQPPPGHPPESFARVLSGALAWLVILSVVTTIAASPPVNALRQTSREVTREGWQNVTDVVKALAVGEGSVVADVGAGGGFFTARLAKLVGPRGHVIAVDVSKSVILDLQRRVESDKLSNVEVVQGVADDPKLPDGELDAVLIVNAYHEMTEHQAMLEHIKQALKPGGRLVLVEPNRPSQKGRTREELALDHLIDPDSVRQDLNEAGFEVIEFKEQFAKQNNLRIEFLMVAQVKKQ
jgi:ubiquinone/menaquinone biosynthesis C-methylase UbiE